ncbi:MAG: putative dehydrogenase [Ignavibacteria bacterium]|nr:putative dehydrogenase [Ignavibacteria bacterium]
MDFDVVIIGAGVVGLAVASKLSENRRTLVIERHNSFGREISSRNSEVIHAGIYYPTGSLKARLCLPGKYKLYEWCIRKQVPFRRIGKYIVAVNQEEEAELERIYNQAKENGVEDIEKITTAQINAEEPNLRAIAALWSPSTGIIDTHHLMKSLQEQAELNGADFAWKHNLLSIEKQGSGYCLEIACPDDSAIKISTQIIINSAGLDSDTVAAMAGLDLDLYGYRLHYCRGHYYRITSGKKDLVHHLIYPCPQKSLSGLGIHITIDLNGELKLGPDTQYLGTRIQDYSIPEILKEKFFKAASRYLKGLEPDDIFPDQAGIRPKLQSEGGVFRDYIISEESEKGLPGFVNLIGIESPGLTSCLEIADMVESLI